MEIRICVGTQLEYYMMTCSPLTTDGDLLAVACRHHVNVWQNPEQSPSFPEDLENVPRMELLLGTTHSTDSDSFSKKTL